MIVVAGPHGDEPLRFALRELERLGRPFVFLDQERPREASINGTFDCGGLQGELRAGSLRVPLASIRAIYHRFGPVMASAGVEREAEDRLVGGVFALSDFLAGRVANRRRAMLSNNSKPYQAVIAKRAGFLIPESLVTNDPDAVLDFEAERGSLIFKSTSSVRSIVRGLTEDRKASLSSVRFLPTQFQERIEGNDIRVHVVGNKALGVRVRGGAIDYRYAALEGARSEFEAIPLTLDLRR